MSDTIKRAMERVFPPPGAGELPDPFDAAGPTLALAVVREAVGRLAWETMRYRCDGCDYETDVWLTVGVEGPPMLREARAYVACPFMVRCWACAGQVPKTPPAGGWREPLNGTMRHVGGTTPLPDYLTLVPDDAAYFVLPHRVDRGDAGADLVVPQAALVEGRRFFYEGRA